MGKKKKRKSRGPEPAFEIADRTHLEIYMKKLAEQKTKEDIYGVVYRLWPFEGSRGGMLSSVCGRSELSANPAFENDQAP